MQRTIKLLAILLGVQLLLAVGLQLGSKLRSERAGTGPLLGIAGDQVDRITIAGPDSASVTLAKSAGAWHLPDAGDFPADGERVRQLVERLAALPTGAPVATSASAQARFKVSDEAFERRIVLAHGDQPLATLLLGTSPALRLSHARLAGQEAIHVVPLEVFDVPARAADWQDQALLAVPAAEVTALEVAGLQLRRAEAPAESDPGVAKPGWIADGLPAGIVLRQDAIERLVGQVAGLRFAEVLGREAKPEYGLATPVLLLKLTRQTGAVVEYRLGRMTGQEDFSLQVSTRPEHFRLASWAAQPLLDAAQREALVVEQ